MSQVSFCVRESVAELIDIELFDHFDAHLVYPLRLTYEGEPPQFDQIENDIISSLNDLLFHGINFTLFLASALLSAFTCFLLAR